MSNNFDLSLILRLVDHLSGPINGVRNRIANLGGPAVNVGRKLGALTTKMAVLGGAAAGLAAFFVKNQLIDTAAQFEKFGAILETLEGSSTKAKASMAWVSDFAARTPFEIDQVMESFVKLRSYGLDPTSGLLNTLGDTAAAMGKDIDMAVEAMADAVNGENERLKEFGITSAVDSRAKKITYTWIENGKTLTKTVDSRNKKLIQSTLEAIWNSKYAGSMAKQSKIWNGMMSNLSDQWTRFKVKIMENGLFDWMNGKLAKLLALIDKMAANGSLDAWAKKIGSGLQAAFEKIYADASKVWQMINRLAADGRLDAWSKKIGTGLQTAFEKIYAGAPKALQMINRLADAVGGFGNLAKISLGVVAAIMAGPLLMAIGQLIGAMVMLVAAFAANPILLALGLVGTAVFLLWRNWDQVVADIKTGIEEIKSWLVDKLIAAIDLVKSAFASIVETITSIGSAIARVMTFKSPFSSVPMFPSVPPMGKPVGSAFTKEGGKTQVGGAIKIEVVGPARVTGIKSSNPNVPLNVDSGLIMPGAR